MTAFHDIEVAYVAPVTLLRQRARNEQTLPILSHARIRVREVAPVDAPIALLAGYENTHERVERRLFDGRLYMPHGRVWNSRDGGLASCITIQELAAKAADPCESVGPLFVSGALCPWQSHMARKAEPLPMGVARIVSDERDAVERKVREAAGDFLSVGGVFYRASEHPCYQVLHLGGMAMAHEMEHHVPLRHDSFSFRVDRKEVCEEFKRRCRDLGFTGLDYREALVVHELASETLHFDEERHNAGEALRLALHLAGQAITALPPESVAALGSLAAARRAIRDGLTAPSAADGVLAGFAATLPSGVPVLSAAVAAGREALALSIPSPMFEAVDDDAFKGLAP